MNISRIDMYAPSFGQVKRSAAERAIDDAKGNIDELKKVKELVEGQKSNKKVDIVGCSGYCPFKVVRRGCFGRHYTITKYDSLKEACEMADDYLGRNINDKNCSDKFQSLTNEILAACKE